MYSRIWGGIDGLRGGGGGGGGEMEDIGGGVDTDSVGEVSGTVGSYYMIKKKCLTIIDDVFDIE